MADEFDGLSWAERQWRKRIEDEVGKLNTDVYVGAGINNPSLVTRMKIAEDKLDTLLGNSKWTIRLLLITLAGVLATFIQHLLFK
jgi:hypothetical protein